jgi:hypothetical protein
MSNIECSFNADRQCDLAQPGGYCTVPECDPDRCPDEAMCVEFDSNAPRLARRYCMKTCNVDGDCRGGYVCTHPTVGAMGECPPYSPTTQASFPVCHRLLDTHRTPSMPTGYCIERGTTMSPTPTDAGNADDANGASDAATE